MGCSQFKHSPAAHCGMRESPGWSLVLDLFHHLLGAHSNLTRYIAMRSRSRRTLTGGIETMSTTCLDRDDSDVEARQTTPTNDGHSDHILHILAALTFKSALAALRLDDRVGDLVDAQGLNARIAL